VGPRRNCHRHGCLKNKTPTDGGALERRLRARRESEEKKTSDIPKSVPRHVSIRELEKKKNTTDKYCEGPGGAAKLSRSGLWIGWVECSRLLQTRSATLGKGLVEPSESVYPGKRKEPSGKKFPTWILWAGHGRPVGMNSPLGSPSTEQESPPPGIPAPAAAERHGAQGNGVEEKAPRKP